MLVEGNRFMYRMVRIIVGTLVDIGKIGSLRGAVVRALESDSAGISGMTAPAEGLYLDRIVLDDEGTGAWPPLESLTGFSRN